MKFNFQKAKIEHKDIIFSWLKQDYIKEFWDNSPEYKDDILNFMNGRIEKSNYFDGVFDYWIGFADNVPFCFIGTSDFSEWTDRSLSETGKTITIDFCIGNKEYLGKNLASIALNKFMNFYHDNIDSNVKVYFLDPYESNSKAIHVYKKAGFSTRGRYLIEEGYLKGQTHLMMVKRY